MGKKIQIELRDKAVEEIEQMKGDLGMTSVADVIRSSIKISSKVHKTLKDEGKVLLVDKDGNEREIVLV